MSTKSCISNQQEILYIEFYTRNVRKVGSHLVFLYYIYVLCFYIQFYVHVQFL